MSTKNIAQLIFAAWAVLSLFRPSLHSEQWINPKEAIGPMIARFQQGRQELTDLEKEEIEKYGYTGLEIMTYVDDNGDQGKDSEAFYRLTQVNKYGHIREGTFLWKRKYRYKNHADLITYNGIKPGDVEYYGFAVWLNPPNMRHNSFLDIFFLTSPKFKKKMDTYSWFADLRKIRHESAPDKDDNWFFGSVFTLDDMWYREPWEEKHRILGEDKIRGKDCFVIESKNLDHEYYLSKRLTWVEKENFLDMHEEQFDKKGRLIKIYDKEWQQIKPWNYWVWKKWDCINLITKDRTILETFGWIFDRGMKDEEFRLSALEGGRIWRVPKNPPPSMLKLSDLPPEPKKLGNY